MAPLLLTSLFSVAAYLYLTSAMVSVWAAYDRRVAMVRFGWIAAGVLFAVLAPRIRSSSRIHTLSRIGLLCAVAAAGLGGYYLLYTFWAGGAQVVPGHDRLHENAVAGALIVLIPLGFGSALFLWRRDGRPASIVTFGLLSVGVLALILTGSRGAMVGLTAGALIAFCVSWRTTVQSTLSVKVVNLAMAVVLLGSLLIYAAVVVSPIFDQWLGIAEWGRSPFCMAYQSILLRISAL